MFPRVSDSISPEPAGLVIMIAGGMGSSCSETEGGQDGSDGGSMFSAD